MNLKENFAYLGYFGFKLTLSKTVNKLLQQSNGKLAWYIHDKNNQEIENYLKKTCPKTYQKLENGYYDIAEENKLENETFINKEVEKNSVIWVSWWQGEKNAPELIKACIKSIRKHSNGHPVIVIDKDNYQRYIEFPDVVIRRFEEYKKDNSNLQNCTLDITQLSDIMRTYLLYYYGGLWCDATMMFTGDLDENLFTDTWSTLGQDDDWYIGRGKWSSFFMGTKAGNGFIKFNYDMHIEYWKNKKYFVHYLMTDHMFDIAVKEREFLKKISDNVTSGNKKCLTINRLYAVECNRTEAEEFFKTQKYHKLSWRWWGNEAGTKYYLIDGQGKQTWLGYLFEKFIEDED